MLNAGDDQSDNFWISSSALLRRLSAKNSDRAADHHILREFSHGTV